MFNKGTPARSGATSPNWDTLPAASPVRDYAALRTSTDSFAADGAEVGEPRGMLNVGSGTHEALQTPAQVRSRLVDVEAENKRLRTLVTSMR